MVSLIKNYPRAWRAVIFGYLAPPVACGVTTNCCNIPISLIDSSRPALNEGDLRVSINQAICPYIRLTILGMMMTKRAAATTRI
jgi:hypothetical protein